MTISEWGLSKPRASTVRAVTLVVGMMVLLEALRVVLFRTVLIAEPVAKVATVAVLCTVMVKFIQLVASRTSDLRILRITGFLFACIGGFVGYLPCVMVTGRPAFAQIDAFEFASVAVGALAGFICYLNIRLKVWRRKTAPSKLTPQ
jgi:hypothetical protein